MDISENTFLVLLLRNEPGKFIVTPWPSSVSLSDPLSGLGLSEPLFRGTEEETREFLAEKGLSSQIETLIKRAKCSPPVNVPARVS